MVTRISTTRLVVPRSYTGTRNTYYVSTSGSASNTGLTENDPITLTSISNFPINEYDQILFKRGETFNGTYTVSVCNLSIGAYGSGNNPLFTGSTDISGLAWTDEGDGTFSRAMAEPDMIYINNERAKLSETPWITITSYPNNDQFGINSADISGYGNIVNSRLTFRPNTFTTEYVYRVTAYASSVITINQDTRTTTGIVGQTIKLLGKKTYLSSNNEWAWTGGRLYIKTTTNPASMNIRMSNYQVGILISDGVSNCTIENISFEDYYYSGIKRGWSNNLIINSCTVKNSWGYGIAGMGNPNIFTCTNCVVHDCNGGIYDCAAENIYIRNNTVYNIGMGHNIGSLPDQDILGIVPNRGIHLRDDRTYTFLHVSGDVSYNTVYNTAYNGITIQGSYIKVHHNVVHDFLQIFNDGAGIYTYGQTNFFQTSNEIYNNVIYDGGETFCAGIYLDSRSIAHYIHDNVIINTIDAGVNINRNTKNSRIEDNIIVDCLYSLRYRQDNDDANFPSNVGNICAGNVLALRSASQFCHYMLVDDGSGNHNPFSSGGNSNSNYYISPYATRIATHTSDASMTFAELQTRYSSDSLSSARVNYKAYVSQAQAEIDVVVYINTTGSDVTQAVGSGYIDVDGNSITQINVQSYGGAVVLKS